MVKAKILLLSHDTAMTKRLEEACHQKNMDFKRVPEMSELVSMVYDEMPNLVVCDVKLSDVGAFDVCQQMKQDVILGYIPLVIVTDRVKRDKRIDCGADLYLERPVQSDEILYHIERIVAQTQHELDVNPLTHLPGNRTSVERMERVLKTAENASVAYVDLKNLNAYNQAYGLSRGDFLIRETALIIKEAVNRLSGKEGFVGHLGGDDFIMIVDTEKATAVAESMIEMFDKWVHRFYETDDRDRGYVTLRNEQGQFEQHPFVTLSIAIIDPAPGVRRHVWELSKTAAEIQRYLKRFPVSTYLRDRRKESRSLSTRITSTAGLEYELPAWKPAGERGSATIRSDILSHVTHVIKTGLVDTHYQPIVHLATKQVSGFEALSRFKLGETTLDTALVFQAARELNVIKPLDVLCARKALERFKAFPNEYRIFINLNRETLVDPECLEMIFEGIDTGSGRIVVELTEQSLLKALDKVSEAITVLKDRHISIAVDDVGGGSVSLREVAHIRPAYIKFDRSLIRQIHADTTKQKILVSLAVFAREVKARTTAEGIETEEELLWTTQAGIDFGQGYLIAKPMSEFQAAEFVHSQRV